MTAGQHADRLAAMLRRVGGAEPAAAGLELLESASGGSEERIVADSAMEGLAKLAAGDTEALTAAEVFAMEAIVLPMKRPVIDIIGGSFHAPGGAWAALADHRANIEAAIPSVGRVEIAGHPLLPYGGTGFFVAPDLVMTNRHVAELFTAGVGDRTLSFRAGLTPGLDLKQEVIPSDPVVIKVTAPVMVHPYWDVALLRIAPDAQLPPPLKLSGAEPRALGDRMIAVVGYPAFSPENDAALQFRIFRGVFERKRLLPGTVMGYRTVVSVDHTVEALAHDASTLGGNSGSAVIDVATGHVLALHFGGTYLVANVAVPAWELAQDRRVVDQGVLFVDAPATGSAPPWIASWDSLATSAITVPARPPTTVPKGQPTSTPISSGAPHSVGGAVEYVPDAALLGGDWYERIDDEQLAAAIRRDPVRTTRLLEETLGRAEAAEVVADLTPTIEEGLLTPRPDPDFPEILLLHGLMGSHLEAAAGLRARAWLSLPGMLVGDLAARLQLAPDGLTDALTGQSLRATGHLRMKYAKAARKWRNDRFVVHPFSYDWRKGVNLAADRLHHFIESLALDRPGRQFVLVAHSMGGVVASLYARRHSEWADRIQRVVLMGVPLGGTFAPFEAVIGSYPFVRRVAWFSTGNDIDDLRRAVATFPGLLDLLPNPQLFDGVDAVYGRREWPDAIAPRQQWLDQSRNMKPAVLDSPLLERASHFVSLGHGTVASLARQDGMLWRGPRTAVGDGTVPGRAAAVDGLPSFRVQHAHDDIPNDPRAIAATVELLLTGACSLPSVTAADLSDTIVLPEAPAPDLVDALQEAAGARLVVGRLDRPVVDWLLDPQPATFPGG